MREADEVVVADKARGERVAPTPWRATGTDESDVGDFLPKGLGTIIQPATIDEEA